jgi:two-component system OmpR family sensor kinase
LVLYLGAIFLLLFVIAALFYKMEYNYEYDSVVSKMKMKANIISSEIIMKHMEGKKFNPTEYKGDLKCALELYTKDKKPLLNNIKEKIIFSKKVYIKDDMIYLVSKATYGHQNVYYIVLKNHWFMKNNKLLQKTIIMFSIIYLFIALLGYFLSKLFLKPIIIQRKKLDNFIKDTTHELNTPITALLMSLNKKDPLNPNNVKRIKLSAKRISEIYRDLTYLFLQDDNEKAQDNINIKDLLEESLDYFKELSTRKNIKMNIDIEDHYMKIDTESFIRLSNNLISNAIKYSNQNSTIDIILKDNKFIVKDTGIGIEEDKQKDIFDRFYRATPNSGGFGIGLDIVSKICIKYNIKIDLISKKGNGSTFILTFK